MRLDRVVAAMFVADRIETPGVVGSSIERIVLALAIGAADGMDRRQVENVEAERGDLRHTRDAVVESAVLPHDRSLAARHHFIPGAGTSALALGQQWHDVAAGEVGPRFGLRHGGREHVVEQEAGIALGGKFLGVGFGHKPRLAVLRHEFRQQLVALARR